MWVTPDGRIRHELLPNGGYDEARGNRKSAYQGRYEVRGNHINYWDDMGSRPMAFAISNRRLASADDTSVTFKWKDYRIEGSARYKTMTLSLLRRPHAHHRDLRAWLRASAPPDARASADQDRHLMSKPAFKHRNAVHHCRWASIGDGFTRVTAVQRAPPTPSGLRPNSHSIASATPIAYRTSPVSPFALRPPRPINGHAPAQSP